MKSNFDLDNFLLKLALFETCEPDLSKLRQFSKEKISEILEAANNNSILFPVGETLLKVLEESDVPKDKIVRIHKLRRLHELLHQEMSYWADVFHKNHLCVSFLKGYGTQACYPQGLVRQIADLDPAVPDLETFWACAKLLINHNYQLTKIALYYDPITSSWSGNACLSKEFIYESYSQLVEFDFSIGAQYLYYGSNFSFEEDFWESQESLCDESLINIPSSKYSLLVLIGELTERDSMKIRDIIDLGLLINRLKSHEIDWIAAELKRLNLSHNFNRLVKQLDDSLLSEHLLSEKFDDLCQKIYNQLGMVGKILPFYRILNHISSCIKEFGLIDGINRSFLSIWLEFLTEWRLRSWNSTVLLYFLIRGLNIRKLIETGISTQFLHLATIPKAPLTWTDGSYNPFLVTPIGPLFPVPLGVINTSKLNQALAKCKEMAALT